MFLALAPLWHFAPTKRQRQQAAMRQEAALGGLFVEFRDLPLPPARLERLAANERQVLYYGIRLPHSRGGPRSCCSWARDGDAWLSIPARVVPPEIVEELPDYVMAVAVDEGSCGLFWREEGDEKQVREMASILGHWRDQIVQS